MLNYYSGLKSAAKTVAPETRSETAKKAVAAESKLCVLMVGMHLTKTRGGITTIITEILNSPLKNEIEFTYIESQAEDFGKFGKIILALQAIGRFILLCLSKHFDLIYVHLGSNASLYRESLFILPAKLFGKKVVSHFHAGDIDNYYPFQSKIGQKFISWTIGLSDSLIAVSKESERQLREITGSSNICVVPNAIDTSIFDSGERTPDEGAVKLLFVGAIGKLKGERDLIKALAILRENKPNIKVSFLGYGAESLKDYCAELEVSEFIEFLGAVSMSERVGFFKKADIFVLPTYAEAMPMSIIEAMSAGLPVVTTPVGGIPELIEDGETGLLFPPGDANALAEKISFLLDNRETAIKIGKKARQKAFEQSDMKIYTKKLRALLFAQCDIKEEKKI